MRNASRVFLGIALMTLCFAASQASDFSLGGAYWNTKDYNAGVGASLKWAPSLGGTNLAFEMRGTYLDDIKVDSPSEFDFEVHAIPVDVGLKWDFTKNEAGNFYIGGGGTYTFLDSNQGQLDDDVGYYAEIGFQVGKPKGASFFAEALYRKTKGTVEGVQSPGDPSVTEDVSTDLSGAAANVGVSWRW